MCDLNTTEKISSASEPASFSASRQLAGAGLLASAGFKVDEWQMFLGKKKKKEEKISKGVFSL